MERSTRPSAGSSESLPFSPRVAYPPELLQQLKGGGRKSGRRVGAPMECQIPGCHACLTGLKPYYQRHRICMFHFQQDAIDLGNGPARFCRQCGFFEPLSAFHGTNKTCKIRLERHNMRRFLKHRAVRNGADVSEVHKTATAAAKAAVAASDTHQMHGSPMSEATELLPSSYPLGPVLDDELYPGDDQEDYPLNCNDWIPDGYPPLGAPDQDIYSCQPEATELPKTGPTPAEPASQESVHTTLGPCSLPSCSQDMFDDHDGMDLALTSVHNHSSDIGSEMYFDAFETGALAESPHSNSEPLLYPEPLPPLPPLQHEPHAVHLKTEHQPHPRPPLPPRHPIRLLSLQCVQRKPPPAICTAMQPSHSLLIFKAMLERELSTRHMASHHNSHPTPSHSTLPASYNTDPSIGALKGQSAWAHSSSHMDCAHFEAERMPMSLESMDPSILQSYHYTTDHSQSNSNCTMVHEVSSGGDTDQPDFRSEWDAADRSGLGESANGIDFDNFLDSLVERWGEGEKAAPVFML